MHLLRRHRWFVAAAGTTLAFAVVSLIAHPGVALTAFADLAGLAGMLAAAAITLRNSSTRPREERSFWLLTTLGFALWASNQASWVLREVVLRQSVPEPNFFDIILFFHVVPLIAAVAWRPDLLKKESRIGFSALNFLMLLGWWIFLYAFLVFPHQYVVLNLPRYNAFYDDLYLLENALLLGVLSLAALTSSGGWRRVYLNFLAAAVVYGIGSQFIDRAVASNTYYSGSLYDVPLIGTVSWLVAVVLSAREWQLSTVELNLNSRWKRLVSRLAMFAILSLPGLGMWAFFFDRSAAPSRLFRLFTVLAAMLVLGAFVFLRQYLQDQTLMDLLRDSRRAFESEKRLQNQLVQREKLASLGTLVAGAAHEINYPLTAVMNYSEQLWAQEHLTPDQNALLRKIVHQAQRTRDLVHNLLSFAQQSPGEKVLVEVGTLLQRAVQISESRYPGGKVQVSVSIQDDFPRLWGSANQLFQVFVEIIENAMDALHDSGGGRIEIDVQRQENEAILRFADSGPGLREPGRVFDPFYTTKPVGKGTGLGLSVVYGVIQDHGGHIICQNRPEGGALFVIRLPLTSANSRAPGLSSSSSAPVAGAARA
jgi:signal transduction histidine kinase